ncbi:MAG: hypothetical protein PUE96_02035 [Oscillospiraceae bacterium]|nr:hypothetical protein [Oscillospiraceae bacterium]
MAGRLYHPALPGGRQFRTLMELLVTMEELLDETQLPQNFAEKRSFGDSPVTLAQAPPTEEQLSGQTATFAIRVAFRQNANWQGSVTWLEKKREESFRSVLELLLLMNSAVSGEKEESAATAGRCAVL